MRKTIYLLLVTVLLSNCTTTPIIDSAGRSGTFNESKAVEITNDLQHCEQIAKQHSNFISEFVFWLGSPEAQTKSDTIYRNCMTNRGHSVIF